MSRSPKQARYRALDRAGFVSYIGPNGRGPVQFEGRLTSGEWVYFRARENHVMLEVYRFKTHFCDTGKRLAVYTEKVPYDAGCMSAAQCVACIQRLIRTYTWRRAS